jgi:hypothetical protein
MAIQLLARTNQVVQTLDLLRGHHLERDHRQDRQSIEVSFTQLHEVSNVLRTGHSPVNIACGGSCLLAEISVF